MADDKGGSGRRLSLGFSPCPNDTYIFDALIHHKIEHPYLFDLYVEDVETLNQMALAHQLDITKISVHGWFHVLDHYRLLDSGGALGRGCGPLLISKGRRIPQAGRIALPGELTTASLLFQMAVLGDFTIVQTPFNEIIPALLNDEVDAGVIIHESRFTYSKFGLHALLDLGEWWESTTNALIPLGGIIISNAIEPDIQLSIQRLIKESILYAERQPESAHAYIREHAQELENRVIDDHIGLYVNEYSKSLAEDGREAVRTLYRHSCQCNLLPVHCLNKEDQLFVT